MTVVLNFFTKEACQDQNSTGFQDLWQQLTAEVIPVIWHQLPLLYNQSS